MAAAFRAFGPDFNDRKRSWGSANFGDPSQRAMMGVRHSSGTSRRVMAGRQKRVFPLVFW
jgi:hypothetical protein